jgi:uncharacterized protein
LDLEHTFTVPASLDRTWAAFEDIESVAGCFPGATVTEFSGDDFKGTCKVKLGPIALTYSGSGTFVEKDREAGRFVIEAKGKDKRGNGTAGAHVTAQLTEEGTSTKVDVTTDLAITGKPAQFGRGVMQDVSDKLLQQFVTCLKDKVGSGEEPAAAPSPEPTGSMQPSGEEATQLESSGPAAADTSDTGSGTPVGEETAGDVSGPRKTPSTAYAGASAGGSPTPPAPRPTATGSGGYPGSSGSSGSDDALDLGATVLPVLARTYGKQAAAGLALLLLGWLLGRRGRR